MESNHSQIVSFIWKIADDILRDVFQRGQYRDVILPMIVLRRLDVLLEPTKEKVEEEIASQKKSGLKGLDEGAIKDVTKLTYFNTSRWTLSRLKSQAPDNNDLLYDNFKEYLDGYSENVRDVLKNFEYYAKSKKLAENDRLLAIIERITDKSINLSDKEQPSPEGLMLPPLTNHGMGTVFEELLRRFNEENNEESGAHFTPRDAINLLARLVFEPVKDNLPQVITLHDPAEGSGGMLTEGRDYLLEQGVRPNAIFLSGTELVNEIYAICKADLIIKGVDPNGMYRGNTITDDHFAGQNFGFQMSNPPYGKSWKIDKERIYHDKQLLDSRYELPLENFIGQVELLDSTPRTSDGQLLFMLEMISKMKPLDQQPQGSRIATIHNGSSLFTGDAGCGESNIRRYVIENDLVDAIIQLPNNIFYNTGISTYVWLLTNKKSDNRRGKLQLIDASQAYEKLRKNLGNRNCTITPSQRDLIVKTYLDLAVVNEGQVTSKVFDNDDFRYYAITIDRPLRLRSQFQTLRIDDMLFDAKDMVNSRWLYGVYREKVFSGLESEKEHIKDYFNDNEIKMPDKKLKKLIDPKAWCARRQLMEWANCLHRAVGNDIYMDYNVFFAKVQHAAKELRLKATAAQLKTIARAMSQTDPDALPVVRKVHKANAKELAQLEQTYGVHHDRFADYGLQLNADGTYTEYEPDNDQRDTEKIPVKEDIYNFFLREVRPYVSDAWINLTAKRPDAMIGCEISFNKYFYKPQSMRTLEENEADIRQLDSKSKGLVQSLFENI